MPTLDDDSENSIHHSRRARSLVFENPHASKHHDLASEHYDKAARHAEAGQELKSEYFRSKAERHADAAEDYEKQPAPGYGSGHNMSVHGEGKPHGE